MSTPVNNANVYLPGVIFIPSALEIVAVTKSKPAIVTISVNAVTASNTYQAGQLVKLTVPYGYGMWQLNGLVLKILETSGSDLTLDVDSTQFDTFAVPILGAKPASLAPFGSRNLSLSNSTNNVPVQTLNDIGN